MVLKCAQQLTFIGVIVWYQWQSSSLVDICWFLAIIVKYSFSLCKQFCVCSLCWFCYYWVILYYRRSIPMCFIQYIPFYFLSPPAPPHCGFSPPFAPSLCLSVSETQQFSCGLASSCTFYIVSFELTRFASNLLYNSINLITIAFCCCLHWE